MIRTETTLPSGTRVSWLEAGPADGHPVVLLHGGGADNAALSWGPTLQLLSEQGYRAIAPDHPGYGRSPRPRCYATMANQIAYVNEFIDSLELGEYDLAGVSMGGGMAIGHVLARPGRVRKLALVASYGYQSTLAAQPLMMMGSWMPGLIESIQWTSWNPFLVSFGLTAVLTNSVISDELAAGVRNAALETPALATFNEFQRHELGPLGNRTDFSDRLREITQPVLLIHGEHDMIFPSNDAVKAAGLFPNAQLELLPGVGHWAQRDDPVAVHALLLDFLAEGLPGALDSGTAEDLYADAHQVLPGTVVDLPEVGADSARPDLRIVRPGSPAA
ncbi:alpha/beta fold hydrolase [Granulicoccus sp. GXG6511]|uniref:alpha/beta fold hydrolase n=1 Tax=Granulicoccus sp. GXG6511 TaxID=3381351 RepID=UPI003D7DF102